MDIRQLQYITTIAKEQNITRASEKLYITRSALNYSLLNLEKELGFPLFKRLSNRLVPTYAGELFLEQAQQILLSCHELSHTMDMLSDSSHGRLNIGVTVGGGQEILMDVFPDFHKKYPDITLHLKEGNSRILKQGLLDGEIDLAWAGTLSDHPLIDQIFIRPTATLQLAVPMEHPILKKYHLDKITDEPVDLRLFKEEYFILMNKDTFIRGYTDELFRRAAFRPKVMMECSQMSIAAHFVTHGVALAFVPSNMISLRKQAYLFSVNPVLELHSTILFRKDTHFNEPEQDLIQRIIERNRK